MALDTQLSLLQRPIDSRLAPSQERFYRLTAPIWDRPLSEHLAAALLKFAFDQLRERHPIAIFGRSAIVTRYPDVRQVLDDSEGFGVAPIYAEKMERSTGAFILGMENTRQYDCEARWLRSAVREGDLERIRSLTEEYTLEAVEAARDGSSTGAAQLDVVGAISRRIPIRLFESYFGVPVRDEGQMMRWMRTIFWDLFLNLNDARKVRQAAGRSSAELNPYLDEIILERREELGRGVKRDDFLSRLISSTEVDTGGRPFTNLDVRRNVGGVIVGAVDTVSKAIAQALAELLRRPLELLGAKHAARDGNRELVRRYAFEALRFHPHNPILLRRCLKDRVVGRGSAEEGEIREGMTVCAATLGAMFDPAVFPEPNAFRLDRHEEAYLHFGHGQHRCFGERFDRVIIPEVLMILLRLPDLRRVPGITMRYEGPFPDRLLVEFSRE